MIGELVAEGKMDLAMKLEELLETEYGEYDADELGLDPEEEYDA